MTRIKDIIDSLEAWAPPSLAESYDNVGLLAGNTDSEVKGVLVSLDCTEEIVDEALRRGCNMIVSHHPLLFKGLKRLTGGSYVERTLLKAIRHDVAIYAIHTNLDNVFTGVNAMISRKLGLENLRILSPKEDSLEKIIFFVPVAQAESVRKAVFESGAGRIGNYSSCSFSTEGMGTFLPGEDANPYIGKKGEIHRETEVRVEIMYDSHTRSRVVSAMKAAHPYEEVAYYIQSLENSNQEVGSGMIGEWSGGDANSFLKHLKEAMELKLIRHTADTGRLIKKVAVCGGSGSFLLSKARSMGADIFITGDFKYHEFFDGEGDIIIADIGHYESERFTIDLIGDYIRKKFSTFAVHLTGVSTNPIHYFF